MQVFTTIFLAETLSSDTGTPEETSADYHDQRGLFKIGRTNLDRIAMLESRNWFLEDLPFDE
ncbi:MAG TPA: hypothetical protein VK574_11225 [Terracidiphilus sp.]|jgi:hypothetical protein|nr:hypothetical protein [Terracidiphilus sp.]